ncbi:uncharacterized protein LOC113228000 [Hyposmocoma kahamanoa]|uniref:uncharacterized protein LOC113228000 n=1 Tax=Hyposmocoma kahamanoa TaxID=1477025 RepID=UPI000E6D86BA|nr:uncharacterized protein LOC113228000 [Hyposmocoma kahamanoa]
MEWCRTEDGRYRIESLSAATFPGALEVVRNAFCQDEVISRSSEINKNPLAAEELLELCADTALDGVSLVAIENTTGEEVAVAFNKLQVPATNASEKTFFEIFTEERCTQDSSRSLINFMADVDGRCNLFEKYGVDCSLELMFLATLREFRDKKLGSILCKMSIELAKKLKNGPVSKMTIQDLGPKYCNMPSRAVTTKYPKMCQVIWTSEISQRIGRNLGFEVVIKEPLSKFVYKGKTFAERIGDDSLCCEVAVLLLY